jgi:hypothetical protein
MVVMLLLLLLLLVLLLLLPMLQHVCIVHVRVKRLNT